MDAHETPRFRPRTSFQMPKHVNTALPPPSFTAYHGAAGQIDSGCPTPSIRLDDYDDFEDVQLKEPTKSLSPASDTREGLGSKWLSSISTASPTASALHTRARSWAAALPKLSTSSAVTSPEKTPNRQSKIFGDLFNGESAPVQLGVPTSPTKEESEFIMEYRPGFTERPLSRRKSSVATVAPIRPAAKSSWFSRKPSQSIPATSSPPAAQTDEFLTMNIGTSLFPHGQTEELSPQAFNDLLLNATQLLQRMQTAYKEKVDYIGSMQPEMDAQREEVEEAETRSKHLKMQLEDIGRQNAEQKQVNEELITQLSQEKMKLQEAREQGKTIRLVRNDTEGEAARRRKRGSAGSASDSGFESDADTSSVFSGGLDTPVSQSQPQLMLTSPEEMTPSQNARQVYSRSSTMTSQQSTAFSSPDLNKRMGGEHAAWATVEQLRHENQALRMRVAQMKSELQGVIDFVGGVSNA